MSALQVVNQTTDTIEVVLGGATEVNIELAKRMADKFAQGSRDRFAVIELKCLYETAEREPV